MTTELATRMRRHGHLTIAYDAAASGRAPFSMNDLILVTPFPQYEGEMHCHGRTSFCSGLRTAREPVAALPHGNFFATQSPFITIGGWHLLNPDGLKAPGPCAINCTNNNEAYGFHFGGINLVLADGATRFVSENIEMEVYASLITSKDGQVLPSEQF